jgi:hypothetical protein
LNIQQSDWLDSFFFPEHGWGFRAGTLGGPLGRVAVWPYARCAMRRPRPACAGSDDDGMHAPRSSDNIVTHIVYWAFLPAGLVFRFVGPFIFNHASSLPTRPNPAPVILLHPLVSTLLLLSWSTSELVEVAV